MTIPPPIRQVVLDIEGTTCPVDFVSEVLFPYARAKLLPFLSRHKAEEPIRKLLQEVQAALLQDPSPAAGALRSEAPSTEVQGSYGLDTLCSYLDWLIQADRKITPRKISREESGTRAIKRETSSPPCLPMYPGPCNAGMPKGLAFPCIPQARCRRKNFSIATQNQVT